MELARKDNTSTHLTSPHLTSSHFALRHVQYRFVESTRRGVVRLIPIPIPIPIPHVKQDARFQDKSGYRGPRNRIF